MVLSTTPFAKVLVGYYVVMGSPKSLLLWMVGIEPTTRKKHGLSTTPFVRRISPFDHLQKVNQ